MRETWVRPLGQEDPLEKEMAIHSVTFGAVPAPQSCIGSGPCSCWRLCCPGLDHLAYHLCSYSSTPANTSLDHSSGLQLWGVSLVHGLRLPLYEFGEGVNRWTAPWDHSIFYLRGNEPLSLFLLSVAAFSRTEGTVYTWVRAISEATPETAAGFGEVRRAVYQSGQAAVTKAADIYFS